MVDLQDRNTQIAIAVPLASVAIFGIYWFVLRKKTVGVSLTVTPKNVNACVSPCTQTLAVKGPANGQGVINIFISGNNVGGDAFVLDSSGNWTADIGWNLIDDPAYVPPTQDVTVTVTYVAVVNGVSSNTVVGSITIKAGQTAPCQCPG